MSSFQMDVDDNHNIMIYCRICNEISLLPLSEFPPDMCCGHFPITFGLNQCNLCNKTISINPETPDLCIDCQISNYINQLTIL